MTVSILDNCHIYIACTDEGKQGLALKGQKENVFQKTSEIEFIYTNIEFLKSLSWMGWQ